ncbi:MAG: hypothetical protein IT424_13665 [Pirellulales bacterium]|nr:hypothetical protein [Pirellulales bacterium]
MAALLRAEATSLASALVTENFSDDPHWAALNNHTPHDNYGYSPTTVFAGGLVGEAGGLFGRHDAYDSFYADVDLGGTLSVREPIQSSGRISIDSTLRPLFNMNISFFDARDPSKGGDALRIHIVEGGRFLLWLRQVVGKTHQSPITAGLVDGDYQWTMSWNPAGNGGLGSGTVTFNGLTPGTPASRSATLNMPARNEPGRPARWIDENTVFNAFGLQVYDAESTTSGQYRVFIDDVSYTAVTAPESAAQWKLRGGGEWIESRNWSPGEPPVGADRTAIFGSGLTQHATVVLSQPLTAKALQFNNPIFHYAVAGASALTLDDLDNVRATVDVVAGQHQIQTPLNLADDAVFSAAPGSRLDLNNAVALNGHTLTITGGGTVALNHLVDAGGGEVIVSAASLSAPRATLIGDLVLSDASIFTASFDEQTGSLAPLSVTGRVEVAGVLDLAAMPRRTVRAGEEHTVIMAGAVTDRGLRLYGEDARRFELVVRSTRVSVRALAIPEPSGIATITVICGAAMVGKLGRSRRRLVSLPIAIAALFAAAPASAELVGQNFNADPDWTGVNNVLPHGSPDRARDDFNNYGYNAVTSNALGAPGEVGGYFGMNTFDSFYGDTTLGGNLGGGAPPLSQPLWASGKLMVNADHSPTWNMNIGFFDANNYGASGDAVRIALIELSPGYRLRLEVRQQDAGYNGPLLESGGHLLEGMYEFELAYNPTGGVGGRGRLSLGMWGPMTVSTFVDIDAAGKNRPMSLNAFGFTNYNSGVSRPDTNKHYTFLDDVVYTTREAADPVVRWAGPGGGSWHDASRWRRTSTAESGGFVPSGSDRTAIFADGAAGPTTVFVDKDARVRRIQFNNAQRYIIAGAAQVILDADAGNATIEVDAGSHEFQAAVALDSDANITVAPGSLLTFNNAVELNARTLTIAASSHVAFNSRLAAGARGFIVNEGRFTGVGRVQGDLLNFPGGIVAPGLAAGGVGQLTVSGDFVQSSAARLAVELAGAAPGQFDSLAIDGRADVQGQLEISLVAGYQPLPGDQFELLTAAGGIDVASLLLSGEWQGFQPLLENDGQSLMLQYVDADFNGDSQINGLDLAAWRTDFGRQDPNHSQGDANGDGYVDGADFLVWQRQHAPHAAIVSAATVPEPGPGASLVWILGTLLRLAAERRWIS